MTCEISQIAVVVPARNERTLLPACLDALAVAADTCAVPVRAVVVLDDCTDDSAAYMADYMARRTDVTTVASSARCVGAARALGVDHTWSTLPDIAPSRLWIANTDADSTVPPTWLTHQLQLAEAGADLVLGTVDLACTGPPSALHRTWRRAYARRFHGSVHSHVHGANLGIRGSTYLAAGGWPEQSAHEDALLVRAVTACGTARVVTTRDAVVITSGRHRGRAPHGVAADLRRLARAVPAEAASTDLAS
jgi:glycosyltransferase involved in cell wall biosynthesis